MSKFGRYFYGNEVSEYGRKNGRVDYATFAKAFDAVLNNDIMNKTWGVLGEWEQESGFVDHSERIEELEERMEELRDAVESGELTEEETAEELDELEAEKDDLENAMDYPPEVYQWYIVDENGANICREFGEILYYHAELDMYLWGVSHFGTSWSYVLTSIECEREA